MGYTGRLDGHGQTRWTTQAGRQLGMDRQAKAQGETDKLATGSRDRLGHCFPKTDVACSLSLSHTNINRISKENKCLQ